MESLGADLRGHGDGEDRRKDRRAGQVAEVHRHRHRIAAGLAEGGCEYLDDPESQGDFRNLARALGVYPVFAVLIHAASLSLDADGGVLPPSGVLAHVKSDAVSVRISPLNP